MREGSRSHAPAIRLRIRLNQAHAWVYRRSGGRLGGSVGGQPVLLLTTVGRRSGRPRTTPVQYQRHRDELLLVASNGGSPHPPAWWLNLQADPRVTVRLGRRTTTCLARTAPEDERARLWPLLAAGNRWLARVEAKAGRQLPVVVLREVGALSG